MKDLKIEKFNPTKAEVTALVGKYKDLKIEGVEDKKGYMAVDDARKELKKVRVQISKDGKELRAEAVAFQKAVLKKEKELIALVEPTELELTAKQDEIKEEIARLKRVDSLPSRKARIKSIEIEVSDDELLSMDDEAFDAFFNEKHAEYLQEKERKQQDQRDKLDAEKKDLEDAKLELEKEKQRQVDLEVARKEAAANAKKEAEEKAAKAIEDAKQKAAEELAEKEKAAKKLAEDEAAARESLEKRARYQEFLSAHEYVDDGSFRTFKVEDEIQLYKRVGIFKINEK